LDFIAQNIFTSLLCADIIFDIYYSFVSEMIINYPEIKF